MPDWVISSAINALIEIARNQRDRKKWARALAKVFDEINKAQMVDTTLRAAIAFKQGEGK